MTILRTDAELLTKCLETLATQSPELSSPAVKTHALALRVVHTKKRFVYENLGMRTSEIGKPTFLAIIETMVDQSYFDMFKVAYHALVISQSK